MDAILGGFRLRPPFFSRFSRFTRLKYDTFRGKKAVLKINLLGMELTQGVSVVRGSILMGSWYDVIGFFI